DDYTFSSDVFSMFDARLPLHYFLQPCDHNRVLPSFPTRRSSDLAVDAGDHRLSDSNLAAHQTRKEQVACGAELLVLMSGEIAVRSEEHTSELQSRSDLVCRLLLEKKKKKRHDKSADRIYRAR